jgi:metal-responsive CopG/Arc/MetJ family transcriptional regulator
MARHKRVAGRAADKQTRTIRASVSLKAEIYRTLEAIAKHKKVSTAWVLRDAAEKYIADQKPRLTTGSSGR